MSERRPEARGAAGRALIEPIEPIVLGKDERRMDRLRARDYGQTVTMERVAER